MWSLLYKRLTHHQNLKISIMLLQRSNRKQHSVKRCSNAATKTKGKHKIRKKLSTDRVESGSLPDGTCLWRTGSVEGAQQFLLLFQNTKIKYQMKLWTDGCIDEEEQMEMNQTRTAAFLSYLVLYLIPLPSNTLKNKK